MADKVSPQKRSAVMAAVRSKGTGPELVVAHELSQLGSRFRKNVRDLPGKPDFANKTIKRAIFVHGCFWHRHADCRLTTTPKSRMEYWTGKFESNVRRDALNLRHLRQAGWKVLVIWECETKKPKALKRRLARFLSDLPRRGGQRNGLLRESQHRY